MVWACRRALAGLSHMCGSVPWSVLSDVMPSDAHTWAGASEPSDERTSSSQASMPRPLETTRSAVWMVMTSSGEGSQSCGSVPAGTRHMTCTRSPPTLPAKSAMG